MNLVLVVGSDRIYEELEQRLAGVYTSLGEPIECVSVEKSDGVAEVVDSFTRQNREAAIKEYFFGDSKRTLSPSLQVISYDDVAIFKAPDGMYAKGCPSRVLYIGRPQANLCCRVGSLRGPTGS